MSRGTATLFAIAVLAALLIAPAGAQESPTVTARMEWEPGPIGGGVSSILKLEEALPEGVQPPAALKEPRYAQHKVAGGKLLTFVFETAPGEERVWIDRDFDGGFSEDTFGRWDSRGAQLRRTEIVFVPFDDEQTPVPTEIVIWKGATSSDVRFQSKLHRVGSVVIGNRVRAVAIRDADNDIKFDCTPDQVLVDIDGDGAFNLTYEAFKQGVPFRLGDAGWSAKMTGPSGVAVEFTRQAEPPPRTPRKWRKIGVGASSPYRPNPPKDSLADLLARFEKEEKLAYVKRHPTVSKIGQVGTSAAFDALARIAKSDSDQNVKAAAVRAMGNVNFLEGHGDAVVKLAKDKNAAIAAAAIQSLYRMEHPGRESIYLALLGASNATVVGAAAKHLGAVDSETARKAVVKAARELAMDAARYQAYQGARALSDGPPVDLMLTLAQDSYPNIRGLALEDLFVLDHPDARKLAVEAAGVRPVNLVLARAVMRVLGAYGDGDAAAALLSLAVDGPPVIRTDIIKRLSAFRSPKAVAMFIRALSSKDAKTRTLAAQILAGIPVPSATQALLRRLKREKDLDAAVAVLEALGDHGDPSAVPILLKATRKKGILRRTAIRALARLGFGLPEVRKFLVKLLDAKSHEDRILAIDAAGASGDVALGKRLVKNLSHDRWEVRLAVAEALRKLRSPDWVAPLIDQLEEEEEKRVRAAIGRTLFELTAMNLYDEPKLWRQWFTDNGATFEMPASIPQLPRTEGGGSVGGFYGIPVESERVVFVIDQSGSMQAPDATSTTEGGKRSNRLDVAVAEVLGAIGQLGSRARVNVILFHATISPWKDELTKLTDANRKALQKHLLRQRPTGGTNIYDALESALADENVDTILFLSDGVPGAGRYIATDDILRGVKRLNQTRRIAIHCVSLGRESDLLKRLAAENGGEYVRR